MKTKNIVTIFLVYLILASCAEAPKPTSTAMAVPTTTISIPVNTPSTPTETPDPMANAPEGTTRVKNGIYYMDTSDGYTFYWDEQGWFRNLIVDYFIFDTPDFNSIPLKFRVEINTLGANEIAALNHKDSTSWEDKSLTTDELNKPLMDKFGFGLNDYQNFINQINSKEGILNEFTVGGKPMTSSFGKSSGVQITLVNVSELEPLVKDKKAVKVQGIRGYIYYTIDGVNKDGSVLFRIAQDIPLNDLIDKNKGGKGDFELRYLLMLPLANLLAIDRDQLDVYNLTLASILAHKTMTIRANGVSDLEIILNNTSNQ